MLFRPITWSHRSTCGGLVIEVLSPSVRRSLSLPATSSITLMAQLRRQALQFVPLVAGASGETELNVPITLALEEYATQKGREHALQTAIALA